jgi:hypothetical protein
MSDYEATVNGKSVALEYETPTPLVRFNAIIVEKLYSPKLDLNAALLDFLHFSQFVRMLPFKVQSGDLNKAKLFYALSCKLIQEMRICHAN